MLYARQSYHEAFTFDELVEFGKKSGCPLHGGMPWSFEFHKVHVTHENDDCYIVDNKHFKRGEMLVKEGDTFEVWPMETFREVFSKA